MGRKESINLFTPADEIARQKAVIDFVAQFRAMLKTSKCKEEKIALRVTIESWEATLKTENKP